METYTWQREHQLRSGTVHAFIEHGENHVAVQEHIAESNLEYGDDLEQPLRPSNDVQETETRAEAYKITCIFFCMENRDSVFITK